jgi:hypothetical protein
MLTWQPNLSSPVPASALEEVAFFVDFVGAEESKELYSRIASCYLKTQSFFDNKEDKLSF